MALTQLLPLLVLGCRGRLSKVFVLYTRYFTADSVAAASCKVVDDVVGGGVVVDGVHRNTPSKLHHLTIHLLCNLNTGCSSCSCSWY